MTGEQLAEQLREHRDRIHQERHAASDPENWDVPLRHLPHPTRYDQVELTDSEGALWSWFEANADEIIQELER